MQVQPLPSVLSPRRDLAKFTPNPTPNGTVSAVVNTLVWEIAYTFNRNGTGSVTGVDHYNILPNPALNISPSAGSANVSWDFTYTVTHAGDITFALAKGSFQCSTYVSGPQQGTTSCVDGIPVDGVISKDGKTITVTCGAPVILNAVDPSNWKPSRASALMHSLGCFGQAVELSEQKGADAPSFFFTKLDSTCNECPMAFVATQAPLE